MAAINIEHGVRPQVLGKNGTNYIYQKDDPGLDTTNISYSFPYTVMNFEIKIPSSTGTSGSGGSVTPNPSPSIGRTVTDNVTVTIYEGGEPKETQLPVVVTAEINWPQGSTTAIAFNPDYIKCESVGSASVIAWDGVGGSGTYTTTTNSSGVTDNTQYVCVITYGAYVAEKDPVTHHTIGYNVEARERRINVPKLTYSVPGDAFGGHYKTENEDLKIFDLTMVET